MDIQSLKERVSKAEEKVEKCKNTIERHTKSLEKKSAVLIKKGIDMNDLKSAKWDENGDSTEFYWDVCSVEQKQDDIKGAEKKLAQAEQILADWKSKLAVEVEKERFLSEQAPAVIVEFLNQWKERVRDWYIHNYHSYIKLQNELELTIEKARERFKVEHPDKSEYGVAFSDYKKRDKEIIGIVKRLNAIGGTVAQMATYYNEEERLKWLENLLEEERKHKLFDLIHRINAVVGSITNAEHLRINEKGNLDGIITGESGKAKIETIGAGGYNIQCFHYRTLVNKIK